MRNGLIQWAIVMIAATATPAATVSEVVGDWVITADRGGHPIQEKLHVETDATGALTGVWGLGGKLPLPLLNPVFANDELSFDLTLTRSTGEELAMTFRARLDGGRLVGVADHPDGRMEIVAERAPAPATAPAGPRAAATAPAATAPAATHPAVTSAGRIGFKAQNGRYQAEGEFKRWRVVRLDLPGGDLEKGTAVLEIDLASVAEKAEKLVAHLLTADFFEVAKYPTATVTITGAKKSEDGTYAATAKVAMHGMETELPVHFTVTGRKPLAIAGTAVLSRSAVGIGQPYEAGSEGSILDAVEISIEATLGE